MICIVLTGRLVKAHENDAKLFSGCREAGNIHGYCQFQTGWIDNKQEAIVEQEKNYQSCKFCGMPITIMAGCGDHDIASGQPCKDKDNLYLMTWMLFHVPDMFEQMKGTLVCPVETGQRAEYYLDRNLRSQYATWLGSKTPTPEVKFMNGL
jgi:hypothetical protein